MDYSWPGSSVHRISQARVLECISISFFRGSLQPSDQTCISCFVGIFFAAEPVGEAIFCARVPISVVKYHHPILGMLFSLVKDVCV